MCVCVRACVLVRVRACMRACVRARARVCVRVCVRVRERHGRRPYLSVGIGGDSQSLLEQFSWSIFGTKMGVYYLIKYIYSQVLHIHMVLTTSSFGISSAGSWKGL